LKLNVHFAVAGLLGKDDFERLGLPVDAVRLSG